MQRVYREPGEEYFPKHLAVKFRHGASQPSHIGLNPARPQASSRAFRSRQSSSGQQGPESRRRRLTPKCTLDVRVVEDGAHVHFKGPAKQIRDVVDIPHQPHPPSSPDLKPIEGCCIIIKEKLRAIPVRPTSIDGLWEAVQGI